MAIEIPGFLYTLEASADLSANQHHMGAIDGNSEIVIAGASVAIAGVIQNKPNAQGAATTMMRNGISKIVAGAAVPAGVAIASNASGRAVQAVSTNFVIGESITSAGADGEIISVLLGATHILP